MIQFIWKIIKLTYYSEKYEQENVIFEVEWECIAQDVNADGFINFNANSAGTVSVNYNQNTPFIPYEQITEEEVWNWINPNINREEIQSNLQKMIEEQKNLNVKTSTSPW
jgi:hypothetical protein